MPSVKEIYEKLGTLITEHPEVSNVPFCACGADSRLNIFRDTPDGPIIALSLEDSSSMDCYIEEAKDLVKEMGVGELSEQHMEYLIQLCMNDTPDELTKKFVSVYAVPEIEKVSISDSVFTDNIKQISIDIAAPADWDGAEYITALLESQGIEVFGSNQEDLTDAYKEISKTMFDNNGHTGTFPSKLILKARNTPLVEQIASATSEISKDKLPGNIAKEKVPEY